MPEMPVRKLLDRFVPMIDRKAACLAAAFVLLATNAIAQVGPCPPDQAPKDALRALAAAQWRLDDDRERAPLALALLPCLASPDPELRDDLALGALTQWLRQGQLSASLARQLAEHALQVLAAPDGQGLDAPFAALLLAEVARVDRLQPLWSGAERERVLTAAETFVSLTRDYRGFDSKQGWRHAVAHGADLLMQLALNPVLDRTQLDRILQAVAAQATPDAHFYVFGEGERLARPVIFVARRGLHSAQEWTAWLGRIALAGVPERATPASMAALARLHNAKALLLPLYASLQESGDADMRERLLPGLTAALRTLP